MRLHYALTWVVSLSACNNTPNEPIPELASITTSEIIAVTGESAISGGDVTSTGGVSLTSRGICYSNAPSPTILNTRIEDVLSSGSTGAGSFSLPITGLSEETTYHVRAYATNVKGTAYGEEVIFTTQLSDVDGNFYTPITIGTQVWLKENLRTSKYANGDAISQPGSDWGMATTTTGGYCYYNDNPSNENPYGKLYNWYAVADPRNLCPVGWHTSTDAEWTTLENFLGGSSVAGGKLKEVGTIHWNSPNTGADNSSGFTGLPGGTRSGADNAIYSTLGTMGRHWTNTAVDADAALGRDLVHNGTQVINGFTNQFNKKYGFSVRCVKD